MEIARDRPSRYGNRPSSVGEASRPGGLSYPEGIASYTVARGPVPRDRSTYPTVARGPVPRERSAYHTVARGPVPRDRSAYPTVARGPVPREHSAYQAVAQDSIPFLNFPESGNRAMRRRDMPFHSTRR